MRPSGSEPRGAGIERLVCVKCGAEHEPRPGLYTCPDCGTEGILDVVYDYDEAAARLTRERLAVCPEPSMWRYLPLLPVPRSAELPRPRTGWTPLYHTPGLLGLDRLHIKDDSRNPTASLKDRATAVALARARAEGVTAVAAASTGNAGCSLAGFAAAERIPCYIFVPKTAPAPKVAQLLVFGATVFMVDGSYDDAFDLATQAIERFGWYNRCCAVNPYLVEGKKTVALEICEQLDFEPPDKVFVPVGDGCIMSGTYKGFAEFQRLGLIDRMPELVGVQAEGASAVKDTFESGGELVVCEACTCADSIAVGHPRNWRKAVRGVGASGGRMMSVSDEEIVSAISELAGATGIFGEPAGVTAFAGLRKAVAAGDVSPDETVVVLMTGSGLKDTATAMRSVGEPVRIGASLDEVERAVAAVEAGTGR